MGHLWGQTLTSTLHILDLVARVAKHKKTHTGRFTAGLATSRSSRMVFLWLSVIAVSSCSKALVSVLKMPTQWQMSHNTHTQVHTLHFIYFQGRDRTQGLLLESTEAFYRTALRQGYCATQAHRGRGSLTPPYTPMGDNGKGGYLLPRRRRERKRGGKKELERWRDRGGLSFIRPSGPPPTFTLVNPYCFAIWGVTSNTHQQWHIQLMQVITGTCNFLHRCLTGIGDWTEAAQI